jgi:hypothetical protein
MTARHGHEGPKKVKKSADRDDTEKGNAGSHKITFS